MIKENILTFKKFEQPADTDSFNYTNLFGWNFFIIDTNFQIDYKIADLIEEAEGIESLEILSRYKCRISIGENFNSDIVLNNIQTIIYDSFEEKEPDDYQSLFEEYKKQTSSKYFATVFVKGDSPDTIFVSTNNKKEAEEKLNSILKENKESKVITTWKN